MEQLSFDDNYNTESTSTEADSPRAVYVPGILFMHLEAIPTVGMTMDTARPDYPTE